MDKVKQFLHLYGDRVFEEALDTANPNVVRRIGSDPKGFVRPIALACSAWGPGGPKAKLRRLEQFLRSARTQLGASMTGITEEDYIRSATAWFGEFYEANVNTIHETTTTASFAGGLTQGMSRAIHRRFSNDQQEETSGIACPNPDCGFKLPKYPGQYPKHCPICHQNMQEGVRKGRRV